jgi:hypothetical protein
MHIPTQYIQQLTNNLHLIYITTVTLMTDVEQELQQELHLKTSHKFEFPILALEDTNQNLIVF